MSLTPEHLSAVGNEITNLQQQILALQSRLTTAEASLASQPPAQPLPHVSPQSRPIKVSPPEYFDGKPSKTRSFLLQLQLMFSAQPLTFTSHASRVTYAATYLRGPAFSWFAPFLEQHTHPMLHDFDLFARSLESAFGDPDRTASAERMLVTMEQKQQPAYQYASEFRRIMVDTKWNEEALASMFYRGLREEVKDELCKVDKPESLAKYMEMAIRIDNRLYERRHERRHSEPSRQATTSKFHRHRPQVPHYTSPSPQPRFVSPSAPTGPEPMQLSATKVYKPLTPQEKEHRRKNRLCLYCGQPNHVAQFCPAKSKPLAAKVYATQTPSAPSSSTSMHQGNAQVQ